MSSRFSNRILNLSILKPVLGAGSTSETSEIYASFAASFLGLGELSS